eukprot:476150-Hanusia_phi.AAC.1
MIFKFKFRRPTESDSETPRCPTGCHSGVRASLRLAESDLTQGRPLPGAAGALVRFGDRPHGL